MRRTTVLAIALLSASSLGAQDPLRVVRITPIGAALPTESVVISFDRPIAGSIDHGVDARRILSIEPAIAGRYEWRDPVTLRFVPTTAWRADMRVTVRVDTNFTSIDGARLAAPVIATFRISGPRLLAAPGMDGGLGLMNATPDQRFTVVFSDSVDARLIEGGTNIRMNASCGGAEIAVRMVSQRRISEQDGWELKSAGGWQRDQSRDSLRRVVVFAPRRRIPTACAGTVTVPSELSPQSNLTATKYAIHTYGPFRFEEATCSARPNCPRGPINVKFSTPVRGSELMRRLRVTPQVAFSVGDSTRESMTWGLEATIDPRTTYTITVDPAMRDVFGQRLSAASPMTVRTTGYTPTASYPTGRLLVERVGNRTLPIEHVNVDTLIVERAVIPDSLEREFLSVYRWGIGDLWSRVSAGATTMRFPIRGTEDHGAIAGLPLLTDQELAEGRSGFQAIRVRGVARAGTSMGRFESGVAVVQITDLAVTARLGRDQAVVWVAGVSDGTAREGAEVTILSNDGRELGRARTDRSGIATVPRLALTNARPSGDADEYWREPPVEGYVRVTLASDRAVVPISRYDDDLSPWTFGISGAYGSARIPVATALFTERGIYRPGETVHLKTIVRHGALGSLRAPARGDSVRVTVLDRDEKPVLAKTVALSEFGTATFELPLTATAPIGSYVAAVGLPYDGKWVSFSRATFRVAEYRPPEFLVDLGSVRRNLVAGDTAEFTARGRYLFGAPMSRAELNWEARSADVTARELAIPGTDGWSIGGRPFSWDYEWEWEGEGEGVDSPGGFEIARGVDTLDARGEGRVRVMVPSRNDGVPRRVTLAAAITDVNRQSVGSVQSVIAHPADFYVAAKSSGSGWFWRADSAQALDVRVLRPDGTAQTGVTVRGVLERRSWHRARRLRDGASALVGEWVTDTIDRCEVVTTGATARCTLTPRDGGTHSASFRAVDSAGRVASTSLTRWVEGRGFVPWGDETQFKMDLYADKVRYSPGDTATILIASPFTGVEAWLTIERERVIESRRLTITDGSMAVKIPITEAHAPNVFVSIVVVRGRSAPPSTMDDPGRPTMRVGYVQLRVTPSAKRLRVAISPNASEYGPGDTARFRLAVRDVAGRGVRSEVALWAVDEGVLALTGFRTPDPLDLLYSPRALGMRLASNLVAVAPQIPDGDKLRRDAGGGGGAANADVLRSRFKTTAFYLGSVVTDSAGEATTSAALPENLTTFRVMAVSVTTGDRFGSGDTSVIVTRPVVARAALPRFLRRGDTFRAGTVVNRRDGAAVPVDVTASVAGAMLRGNASQRVTLPAGAGRDIRFDFAKADETPTEFTFNVASGADRDAVRVTLPGRSDQHAFHRAVVGVLRDRQQMAFAMSSDVDPARSTVTVRFGTTTGAVLMGALQQARVYPYACTEQISSAAQVIISILRSRASVEPAERERMLGDLATAVQVLSGRQRDDGSIGYWSSSDWSSPWLTSRAGSVLLDARDLGVAVDSGVVARLVANQAESARGQSMYFNSPLRHWYAHRAVLLSERVAAADLINRTGRPDAAVENELLRMASVMSRADRLRLAEMMLRRGAATDARPLIEEAWRAVTIEGTRAKLVDTTARHYFESRSRSLGRLLTVTLMVEPRHPLIAPIVDGLVTAGRAEAAQWNSSDLYEIARALSAFDAAAPPSTGSVVLAVNGRRIALPATAGDTILSFADVLVAGAARDSLRVTLESPAGSAPAFFHVSTDEYRATPNAQPSSAGFRVERWYERLSDGQPVTQVTVGDLVRVRIRVTTEQSRDFVVVEDPLPAGLEAIDLSLRTAVLARGGTAIPAGRGLVTEDDNDNQSSWGWGRWEGGWWTPWDYRELRDDRVVYAATVLWRGTHEMSYLARATTPGTFTRPPTHAEEMYNRAVFGRAEAAPFTVRDER